MSEAHGPTGGHDHEAMPEGEEQAPPGTRAMAVVRWALVGLMALAAVAAWVDHVRSARTAQQEAGVQYICPMHPQIVTSHKGECPICGMDLVPAGQAKGAAAGQAADEARYTCPMHPAFVTTDPKARCPDCGMKLVPLAADAPAAPAGPPVPGLAPVELTFERTQLIGMKTAPAVRQTIPSTIRASGYVAANEAGLVSVNTRFSGWVESLAVGQTGQLVEKGEVLASIYSPEMLNAQQVFLNAIKWTERKPGGAAQAPAIANDLERDARLRLELLGVAPQDIDAIAEAGQPQRAINVRAPVRAWVSRKSILKGLYVQSGTELFQLADLSTVWVIADVYESEISRVRLGQKATLEVKTWPGRKFTGRVQFIYPALNTGSRTLQARIELHNPSLQLRPGMYGDVALELGAAEAVVVPIEALIDTGDHQYVFVDRGGGRFEPRAVQVGWRGDGRVALLAGVAAGEKVVTTANFLLDSESRLRAAVEGFNAGGAATPAAPGHEGHGPAAQPTAQPTAQPPARPPAPAPAKAPAKAPPPAAAKAPAPPGAAHPPPAGAAPAGATVYTCPMHPEVETTDANARCPKCYMRLVPRTAAAPAPAPAADPHAGHDHADPRAGHDHAAPAPAPSGPKP